SFYQADQGFAQFVDRYNLVISDPKTLKEYLSWMDDQVVYAMEQKALLAKGKVEGKAEQSKETALKAFESAKSSQEFPGIAETLKRFGVPEDVIESALRQVQKSKVLKNKRGLKG
ncbi:MAG: hypothetical protein LBS60_09445, partial [Deltaproteobacteria bacterium]|nr:hypothetical protein [Deltaproteobacteria bacterium]